MRPVCLAVPVAVLRMPNRRRDAILQLLELPTYDLGAVKLMEQADTLEMARFVMGEASVLR